MRNLLALIGAAVVTVLGVGWYLDWFKVHREPTVDGKSKINVEFNTNKISEDLHKGGEKLQGVIDKKFKDETPPNPFSLTSKPGDMKKVEEEGPSLGPVPEPPPAIPPQ